MKTGKLASAVVLLAFGLFWCTLTGVGDYFAVRQIARQWVAASYPSTPGQITASAYTSHQGSKSVSYLVNIRYTYQVAGHTWTGNRFRYDPNTRSETALFNKAAAAAQMVADDPVGSTVTVFYNPANPQDALLAPGVDGSDLMFVLFITPFNFVGVAILWGVWGLARRAFSSPLAGGVKIIRDGFRLRVRLPVFTPLASGMITTGAAAFVASFPLLGFYAGKPPLGLALGAIAAAYGAGLIAFALQWRKISAGKDDLVIDAGARTLELPQTYGRKEQRVMNFSEIASVTVEVIVSQNSRGGSSFSYAPTIHLHREEGKGEQLVNWSDSDRANAFRQWLREQIRLDGASGR